MREPVKLNILFPIDSKNGCDDNLIIIKVIKMSSSIKGFNLICILKTIFARIRYILSLMCGPKLSYNNPNCTSGWLTLNNAAVTPVPGLW